MQQRDKKMHEQSINIFSLRAVRLTVTIVNVILRRFLLNLQQTRIKIRMENNLAHQAMA